MRRHALLLWFVALTVLITFLLRHTHLSPDSQLFHSILIMMVLAFTLLRNYRPQAVERALGRPTIYVVIAAFVLVVALLVVAILAQLQS